MTLLHDPLISFACAIALAALFMTAAAAKADDMRRFRSVLSGYLALPPVVLGPMAWLIAALEAAIAVALIFPATRSGAGLAAAALLLAYAAGMGITLWRGRPLADCGCTWAAQRQPVSAALIWRNLALALVASIAILPVAARPMSLFDWAIAGFAALVSSLLYLTINSLIGTTSFSRELSK